MADRFSSDRLKKALEDLTKTLAKPSRKNVPEGLRIQEEGLIFACADHVNKAMQMQHDDDDDDDASPTEETMVDFFRDLATKCHAYYEPLPIASNTYPYMPREEYTHLIGQSKATSRVKAIGRVLAAHPEIALPNPLFLKEYHAKHPPLHVSPPTFATAPASGKRKGSSPRRFLLPTTTATATKRPTPHHASNRRPTAAEREAAALNGAKTTRTFISKMLASEDIKELVRSQQGREFVIGLMKTEMALDDDP